MSFLQSINKVVLYLVVSAVILRKKAADWRWLHYSYLDKDVSDVRVPINTGENHHDARSVLLFPRFFLSLHLLLQHAFILVNIHSKILSQWCIKLQALVYNILPATTAAAHYATGLRKLSANGQFFVGDQMAGRL